MSDPPSPRPSAPEDRLRRAIALFYVTDLAAPQLSGDDLHHLVDVLHPRLGEEVAMADGRGGYRFASLLALLGPAQRRRNATPPDLSSIVRLEGEVHRSARVQPELTIAFAMPKGERLDLIVAKLTELGIDHLVPLMTERSVVRVHRDEAAKRRDRLTRIANAAAQQSRRLYLPEVHDPLTLAEFFATAPQEAYLVEPGGAVLSRATRCLVIGPEGGFSPRELELSLGRVGLGPTVLRVETAAIAAGTLLAALRAGVL